MDSEFYFGEKKYISSKRASEITGYTSDYIGQLCRNKKINSQMVGRSRYVSEDEILAYKNSQNILNNYEKENFLDNPSLNSNSSLDKSKKEFKKSKTKKIQENISASEKENIIENNPSRIAEIDKKAIYEGDTEPLFPKLVRKINLESLKFLANEAIEKRLSAKPKLAGFNLFLATSSGLAILLTILGVSYFSGPDIKSKVIAFPGKVLSEFVALAGGAEDTTKLGYWNTKQKINDLKFGLKEGVVSPNENLFTAIAFASLPQSFQKAGSWVSDLGKKLVRPWFENGGTTVIVEKEVQGPTVVKGNNSSSIPQSRYVQIPSSDRSYVDYKIAELREFFINNPIAPNVNRYYVTRQNDSIVDLIQSGSISGGGTSNVDVLNDLSDVNTSSLAYGNLFMYNGSEWVNVATSSLNIVGSGNASTTLLSDTNFWSGVNRFSLASSTYHSFVTASTTNLVVNGETITDLTGTGLTISGGVLTATGLSSYDAWAHPQIGFSATTSALLISTSTASSDVSALTVASSTASQLALSAGAGLNQWTFRNAGGNLYLSTTTVAGTATSSISALEISGSGFGTTTLRGLNISGQATSTSNVGYNITTGCYAVNGTCLSGGGGLSSYDAWTHPSLGQSATTSLMQFFGQASTSQFTATSSVYLATVTGNVGIGTTVPSEKLHISSSGWTGARIDSGNISNGAFIDFYSASGSKKGGFTFNDTSNSNGTGLMFKSYDTSVPIRFGYEGGSFTEYMRINSLSGFVGISTSTPYYNLTIASTTGPQLSLSAGAGLNQWTFRNAGGNLYLSTTTVAGTATTSTSILSIDGSTGGISIATSTSGTLKTNSSGLVWVDTSSGTAASSTLLGDSNTWSGTNNFTIKTGFGTSTPWGLLSVNPNALGSGVPEFVVGSSTATRLIVTGAGNVGIGTTSPSRSLYLESSSPAPFLLARTSSNANVGIEIFDQGGTSLFLGKTSTGGFAVDGDANISSSPRFLVDTSGNLTASGLATGGTECLQADSSGVISKTGSGCGSASGLSSYDAWTHPLITWSATSSSIMVGTTTNPWATLTSASSTKPQLSLSASAGLAQWTFRNAGGNLYLSTTTVAGTATSSISALEISGSGFGTTTLRGLNISGQATSTSNVGYNITTGCYAIGGNCVGGGTASSTLLSDFNTWSNTNNFATNIGFGTSSPGWQLQIATTSANGGFRPQLNLTDMSASTNLKHWGLSSFQGNFYIGTSTDVTFASTSASALSIMNSNGYVGIGATTTPFAKLSVNPTSGQNGLMVDSASGPGLFVDSTGRVSVGTTNIPTSVGTSKFSVTGTGGTSAVFQDTNNYASLDVKGATEANITLQDTGAGSNTQAFNWTSNGGTLSLRVLNDALNSVVSTPFGIAASTGNVGIGTGPSTNKLTLQVSNNDGMSITNGSDSTLLLTPVGSGQFRLKTDLSGRWISFADGDGTSDTMVVRSGSVGIGTSTPSWLLNPTSATASQLALSAGAGLNQWTFRNAGGNLYLSTTTVAGTATSSISALEISGSGFGTTTLRGLNISGQATSTSNVGYNITTGCYAIGGNCVGGSSFSNTLANGGTATTTFYNGGVIFASSTGSGLLSQSSSQSNFFWDETNKRLGLGTSTPWGLLSVNPSALGSGVPEFVVGSSTATRLIVTGGGNVGIGTAAPEYKLDVIGGTTRAVQSSTGFSSSYALSVQNNSTSAWLEILNNGGENKGAFFGVSGNNFEQWNYQGGDIMFFTNPSASNGTERMRITNSGLVGISTSTPYYSLTVASTTGPQLSLSASAGLAQWTFRNAGGNLYLSTTTVAGTATSSISALEISGSGFGTTTLRGLNISGQATSTSNVGYNITTGCYAVNGTCLSGGGGSGTVNSGVFGQLAFYGANGTAVSGTSTIVVSTTTAHGRVGIATSTNLNATLTLQGAAGTDILRVATSTSGSNVIVISEWGGFVQNISSSTAVDIKDGVGNSVLTVDTTNSSTSAGLDVTAATGQTANLLNFYSSGGSFLSGFTAAGGLHMNISSSTVIDVLNGSGSASFIVNSSSKSIGVGTSTLTYNLNVDGSQAATYIARINNAAADTTADGLLISLGVANASRTTSNYFIGFSDGAQTVAGKIQGGTSAVAYTTTAADLAEYFAVSDPSDMPKKGEIITLDLSHERKVRRANGAMGDVAFGIVSTNPGFIGNGPICPIEQSDCDSNYERSNVLVAIAGQVPIRISNENGEIRVGDRLALSSTTPGVAVKATISGQTLGIALTNATSTSLGSTTVQTVMAYIDNSWQPIGEDKNIGQNIWNKVVLYLENAGLTIGDNFIKIVNLVTEKLVADRVETKELCIDEVCINREQLQALVNNSGITVIEGDGDQGPDPISTSTPPVIEEEEGDDQATTTPEVIEEVVEEPIVEEAPEVTLEP